MSEKYWMYSMMPKHREPLQSAFSASADIQNVFDVARHHLAKGAKWVMVIDPGTGSVVYFDPRTEYLVRNPDIES
jgi:hypothetical protein